jgi:putative ABC transport system permease protein
LRRYALAYKHLKGRPLRTSLTVAALGISVGLMGLLLVIDDAFKRDFSPNSAQRLVVIPKTSMFDHLPMTYQAKIAETPGVSISVPWDFLMGFYKDEKNQVPISAAPAEPLLAVYKEADVPPEEAKAWLADPRGALITRTLRKKYGWKPGDRIVLKAPVKGDVVEFTVRAVMRYDLDFGVYVHRKYFEGLTGREGEAGMFWVLARSRDEVAPLTAALEKKFDNAPAPILSMTERQWQVSFFSMLGNVKALIGGIGIATAFAVLLITSNTIAMGARERRGEAALLRILGFSRGHVLRILLAEALGYGALGALVGCALMALFSRAIGSALEDTQLNWLAAAITPTTATLTMALALSIGISVAAGVVPALGLARRSIVQLLREG